MTKPEGTRHSRERPQNRALRLVFEFDRRDVKLISIQRVAMISPPPQAAVPRMEQSGSWLELRDDTGRSIYRRVIQNPVSYDLEVVTEDEALPLERVRVSRPRGTFHLVVPELPSARRLVLMSESPPRRTAARKTAAAPERDVFEFELSGRDSEEH